MKLVYRAPPPYPTNSADPIPSVISDSLSPLVIDDSTATAPSSGAAAAAAAASSNPVHWQTAFWAIATVALNSVTQESCSDTVLLYPRAYSELVRSSPVFCTLDNLYKLICIIYLFLRRQIALPAAIKLATSNSSDERRSGRTTPPSSPHHSAHSEDHESSSSSEKPSATYWIPLLLRAVLLIAAFNAMIKIMAFKGLPWTQAFCMLYFITYLLEWVWFAVEHSAKATVEDKYTYESTLPTLQSLGGFMRAVAVILQIILWIAIVRNSGSAGYNSVLSESEGEGPFKVFVDIITFVGTFLVLYMPYIIMMGFFYFLPILLAALADLLIFVGPSIALIFLVIWLSTKTSGFLEGDNHRSLRNFMDGVLAFVALGGALTIMIIQGLKWGFSHALKALPFETLIFFTFRLSVLNPGYNTWEAVAGLLFSISGAWLVYYVLFKSKITRLVPFLDRITPSSDTFWVCIFFFLNLGTCLFYFSRYYDDTKTWAPAWLSRLP